ncbi:Calx-beta domain-containing protein [Pararoseomonas sp. SCSIO 73927]|uniref:Calx-beta domain-containing protein n=1 Tax=Pararoseomonas sp. SCSIO 73927 TaxID=3114537 RepID=UPI0030D19A66
MSTNYWSLRNQGSLTQNWSAAGLISAADDWSGVPSIVGYRGDDLTGATGADPRTLTAGTASPANVIANQTNTSINNGGIAEFEIANPTVALQGSGTADAPNLVIYLDTTGVQDVRLAFTARDIDGTIDNAVQQLAVQYRVGGTGAWTNLPNGYVADATSGPSLATQTTDVSVTLPPDAANQGQVEVRIITTNAGGSDEWVGIDDIAVTSSPLEAGTTTLTVSDATVVEGNDGTQNLVFTVTRSNADSAFTVNYATAAGTATADADFTAAAGTLSFGVGDGLTRTVTVAVAGDTAVEGDETLTLNLSGATGGVQVTDAAGTGTITNDDVAVTRIFDIQGAGHTSDFAGQTVTTTGVVTGIYRKATGERGFFIQDPEGDGNDATSDGVLVFTGGSYADVAVGDLVQVTARVTEFTRAGQAGNLSLTELTGATVLKTGAVAVNPETGLPVNITPVVIGNGNAPGERVAPTGSFGDDPETGTFDVVRDSIDFYESLEGMAVTLEDFQATAPSSSFTESWGVTNGASNPDRTPNGGVIAKEETPFVSHEPGQTGSYDFNPERVQLENDLDNNKDGAYDFNWTNNTGAGFGDATGIVSYDRGAFEVHVTEAQSPVDTLTEKEVTTIEAHADRIRIASFNVENLAPSDGTPVLDATPDKLDRLVTAIRDNLKLPEIISLQEVQDSTGATDNGVVDATATLRELIQAIYNQTGKLYAAIDAPPENNQDGGAPGGNIRTAYLFDATAVRAGGTAELDGINNLTLVSGSDDPTTAYQELIYSYPTENRIGVDAPEFEPYVDANGATQGGTRKSVPVVFESVLSGENFLVVNNHFNSKGGSNALFGTDQDTPLPNEDKNQSAYRREAQAEAVRDYIESMLGTVPKVVVTGDINEYQFFPATKILTGELEMTGTWQGGAAENTPPTLIPGTQILYSTIESLPENERYTYVFEGNSQVLDQILLSAAANAGMEYDAVHMNAEFADQISDHDPSVVSFVVARSAAIATGGDDVIDARAFREFYGRATNLNGDDIIQGLGGNDRIVAGTGNDRLEGGSGDDVLLGGEGDDRLLGGEGNDRLIGDAGNDTMAGGNGNDIYTVTEAGDVVIELAGNGTDRVLAYADYALTAEVEALTLMGTAVSGLGNALNNRIIGNELGNVLNGGAGSDALLGGAGDDLLIGGTGRNTLTGEEGADRFRFNAPADGGATRNTITDFEAGVDRIELSRSVFTAFTVDGEIAAEQFGIGRVAATAEQRVVYDPGTGRIVYDADGAGGEIGIVVGFAQANAGISSADIWAV